MHSELSTRARLIFRPVVVTTVLAFLSVANVAKAQFTVLPGWELFTTDEDDTHFLGIEFAGAPLTPPTFNFPGQGFRAVKDTDTIVQRLETASVPSSGLTDTIDIELVLLSLRSKDPIVFDPGSGLAPAVVYVTLQKDRTAADVAAGFPVGPPSLGTMAITFDLPDGGTFDATILVYADLRHGSRTGPIVCGVLPLPPCADFDAGFTITTTDSPWSRQPPPESIRIKGVNRELAAPFDITGDFWAGGSAVTPGVFVCISHGGHPNPGGAPAQHRTCWTSCTTIPLVDGSGCDGADNDCDGIIDDCPEDITPADPTCAPQFTHECDALNDVSPGVAGVTTATDDCNPTGLVPSANIGFNDFVTPRCGRTFDVDRIWAAADNCGNETPCLQQIFVVDTTPPAFANPIDPQFEFSLWPPGHGYVVFSTDDLVSATDVCGEVTVAATECHSTQPENATGDGNTLEDCVLSVDGKQFAVRAERRGNCGPNSSRTYTVTFSATDECGNSSQATGLIHVEHDRSNKPPVHVGERLAPNEPPPFDYVHPTTYGAGCGP